VKFVAEMGSVTIISNIPSFIKSGSLMRMLTAGDSQTQNRDRIRLEPLQIFPAFYGTRRFITAFTKALGVQGSF
jgi:hypothetical protein